MTKTEKKTLQDCTVEEMLNELQRRYDGFIVTISIDRKTDNDGVDSVRRQGYQPKEDLYFL